MKFISDTRYFSKKNIYLYFNYILKSIINKNKFRLYMDIILIILIINGLYLIILKKN